MLRLESFICGSKRCDDGVFVNINDKEGMKKITPEIDTHYINGAIVFEIGKHKILDFDKWDLIDQLWSYIINSLEDMEQTGESFFHFPDQPIRVSFKKIDDSVSLKIDGEVYRFPHIVSVFLIIGAKHFFETMNYYFNFHYSSQLKQINDIIGRYYKEYVAQMQKQGDFLREISIIRNNDFKIY